MRKSAIRIKLLVLIDVPEELHAYTIPKLTLQPLIENAIIHGFHNSLNEVIITVTADSDEKSIILHIKDNSGGIPDEIMDNINHWNPSDDSEKNLSGCSGCRSSEYTKKTPSYIRK